MKLRKFEPEDEEQCIALRKECWEKLLSKAYPKEVSDYWINLFKKGGLIKESKGNTTCVAEENGKILAFLSIKIKGENAELAENFVRFSERNKGVGKTLYQYTEKELLKKHPEIKTIIAESVWFRPSIEFYESIGFKKIKTVVSDKNPKDKTLLMEKNILSN